MNPQRLEWAIAAWMVLGVFQQTVYAPDAALASGSVLPSPAQGLLAQASEFDYEDFNFWSHQCGLLYDTGDYEAALASCEQAISLKPNDDNFGLWTTRGNALFHLGQYVEALVSYQWVTAVEAEAPDVLTYQCATLVQLGQFDQAVTTCETALQSGADWEELSPAQAWYYQGLAFQGLEQWPAALQAYDQAKAIDPRDPRITAEACVLSTELDLPDRCSPMTAVEAYDQALAREPDNSFLWYRQGLLLEQLGRFHPALVSFQKAVEARPDYTLALAHQCAVLNEMEDFEAASSACKAAFHGDLQWDGLGPAYGWSQISAAQIGQGDYEAALASAERATTLNPEYLGGWNNRAVSLWHLRRYEAALQAIAVEADRLPQEPFLFDQRRRVLMASNRGLILYALGRYSDAIAAYSQALSLQKLSQGYLGADGTLVDATFQADLWTNLANAQLASGQFTQATSAAITATQQQPTSADAWYTLALVYLSNQNLTGAWQAYQQAARLEPERTDVLVGQGLTLKQANCPQAAFQVFGVLLNLDPSNQVARQQYSQLLEAQRQTIGSQAEPEPETEPAACSIPL